MLLASMGGRGQARVSGLVLIIVIIALVLVLH
jgi:hypothetical protein